MYLNTIRPADGSKKKRVRVGRGIGCTLGKTCGRGHKGQHARSGGYHKTGFEGGQMPLQRRLPKVGFKSQIRKLTSEVRLGEINSLCVNEISLEILKSHNLVPSYSKNAKVINSGKIDKPITIRGLKISKGAKDKIILVGGKVEV